MRFKNSPQLRGAGRTRAWHHHGSHTPTSPGAILLSKMACQSKHIGHQCILELSTLSAKIQIQISICRLSNFPAESGLHSDWNSTRNTLSASIIKCYIGILVNSGIKNVHVSHDRNNSINLNTLCSLVISLKC